MLNAFYILNFKSDLSFITEEHIEFFAPKASIDFNTAVKAAGMFGFWREASYVTIYKIIPFPIFIILIGILIFFTINGYLYLRATKKREANFFLTIGILGLILALGITSPLSKIIFDFLFNHIPFFSGFRDTHKFVSLLVIGYAYLGSLGFKELLSTKKRILKNSLIILTFSFLIFYNYPQLGLHYQLQPLSYPESYDRTNAFLTEQNITGYIIYLPWYDYLTYNWSLKAGLDGRLGNPINSLIKPRVITNPGPFGRQTNLTLSIEACLELNNTSCLEDINVQYVIKDYCFLNPNHLNPYNFIENSIYKDSCIEIHKLNNKEIIAKEKTSFILIFALIISLLTIAAISIYLLFL